MNAAAQGSRLQFRVRIFWGLLVGAAVVRLWTSFGSHTPNITACIEKPVTAAGIIAAEPERKETGQILVVDAAHFCGAEHLLLRVKTRLYPRFAYGDRILFSGKISRPFNFASDSGREFDYRGYLAKDDIYYEMKSASVVRDTASADRASFGISSILYALKRRFVGNLERVLGEPHAALAAGLVVGEKSALGKDLLNDFRIVGLIHIVVLSGYNITIVGDALRRTLSFLPRAWGIAAGGAGIGLFGILVGGGATVVRSCFMAVIALSADLIRRDYNVHRALAFAALAMLIQNPLILLHDPSFQLSFLATLALVLLASPFERLFSCVPEKFGLRGIVASTIATQVFVSPYILYMMGSISLIGMVVNILVLPLIPLTMLAVFLAGAAGFGIFLGPVAAYIAQGFGWIAHGLLSYELFMVETCARIPFAALEVPKFSGWIVSAAYGVILSAYGIYAWKRMRKPPFQFP